MEIRFYRDTDGQLHVHTHGVTEHEVREALLRRGEDRPGSEGSRIKIGHTSTGRVLRIIYCPDPDGLGLCVITAYDLTAKPLRAYRRRQRRRGRR